MKETQYDDHIWMTVAGSAWAIRAIHRNVFYLWRGYMDDGTLELASVDVSEVDWVAYCDKAVEMIEQGIW